MPHRQVGLWRVALDGNDNDVAAKSPARACHTQLTIYLCIPALKGGS